MSHAPPLPAFLESFAVRVREVPLWLRIALITAAFAVTGYWCATDAGLYRLFRDGPSRTATQIVFYPRAALFTLGATLVPAVLVLLLLGRRHRPTH